MKPDRDRIVFSTSQFRKYGATSMLRLGWEREMGCPALYKAVYVDGTAKCPERLSEPLTFGTVLHEVLFKMERYDMGPEDALARSWNPQLPESRFKEALDDLRAYMERGGPMTRYGTLDVELDLEAKLYDDGRFGPVYFRGIVDWLGVDPDVDRMLHVVDYKTNRHPPRREELAGDVQLKAYAWLVRENHRRWMKQKPLVVVHLDAIKWKDVDFRYTDDELDEWQAWAEACARAILRDDRGLPQLNDGCNWCPIRSSCSVMQSLPVAGVTLAEAEFGQSAEEMWEWRQQAASLKKVLEGRIAEVDSTLETAVRQNGGQLTFADQAWHVAPSFTNTVDARGLYERLGDRAFELLKTSRSACEKWRRRNMPDESFDSLYGHELSGETVTKARREP